MTSKELKAKFRAKLKSSGLTERDAKQLRLRLLTRAQSEKLCQGLTEHHDGFLIPYFDVKRNYTDFYRFRSLEDPRGFCALTGKSLRYRQPRDSVNQIYLPHLFLDWKAIAADVKQDLILTEGELKAAAAAKHGLACLALGGVWNFQAASRHYWLIPSFGWIQWKDRVVYVCFDSDVATNINVLRARNQLCDRLTELGAQVFVIDLPELEPGKKTGLDDFLVARGKEKFEKLKEQSEEWAACCEIRRMNEKALLVHHPPRIYLYSTGQLCRQEDFKLIFAPRKMIVVEGKKSRELSVASRWLESEQRKECLRLTFDPRATPQAINQQGEFNMFAGLPEPEKGDVTPFDELWDHVFLPEEVDARRWLLQWFAYPLQMIRDGGEVKMHSAAATISATEGTGKGLVGQTVGRIYGPAYTPITPKELHSEFNEWAKNRLLGQGNEITGQDNEKYADPLKELITEPTLFINEKNVPRYSLPNFMNLYFTSNHEDAFFLSWTDRRFFVHRTREQKLLEAWGRKKLDAYIQWRDSELAPAHLLWYLLHVDLRGFDHRQPLVTAAKEDMQESSANQAVIWCKRALENPETYLRIRGATTHLAERRLWLASELLELSGLKEKRYEEKGMGHALGAAGWVRVLYKNGQTRTIRGLHLSGKVVAGRLWTHPRYKDQLRGLTEKGLAAIFDKERKMPHGIKGLAAKLR